MNRSEWEQIFKEQCYLPAAEAYIKQVLEDASENAGKIHKELNGQLDAFFYSLSILQEHHKLGDVRTVSISFPYTSLACGAPYLLYEVYPDHPFIDDAEVLREFPVSWLLPGWEGFLEQVHIKSGEAGMNSVIRMPYIRSRAWQTAGLVMKLMSAVVKYHLYGLDEMAAYRQLKKSNHFTLYFGEYMDWQRPVFGIREAIDIFHCDEEEDLRFRRFENAWYEDKSFDSLILDDCQFQTCTFQNSRFSGVSFKDARFLGCTFNNCGFSKVELNGARFDGCVLEDLQFEQVATNSFSLQTSSSMGMQGMTEFIGCFFHSISFEHCDLSAGSFRSCQMDEVNTKECMLSDSFNDCYSMGKEREHEIL